MPLYFFHLSFGDRILRDEEGLELPSQSAARGEAMAVMRDLSKPKSGEPSRRWAGWFIQVADERGEFLRLPLGLPALEVVSPSRRPMEGERRLNVSARSTNLGRASATSLSDGAGLLQQLLAARERSACLRERSRQLQEELSYLCLESQRILLRARQMLTSPQGVGERSAAVENFRKATKLTRRPTPHLTILPGRD